LGKGVTNSKKGAGTPPHPPQPPQPPTPQKYANGRAHKVQKSTGLMPTKARNNGEKRWVLGNKGKKQKLKKAYTGKGGNRHQQWGKCENPKRRVKRAEKRVVKRSGRETRARIPGRSCCSQSPENILLSEKSWSCNVQAGWDPAKSPRAKGKMQTQN